MDTDGNLYWLAQQEKLIDQMDKEAEGEEYNNESNNADDEHALNRIK